PDSPLSDAIWIDLYLPTPVEVDNVKALGIDVPSLAEMEEIEVSSRLYRESGCDYMTLVLPGMSGANQQVSGPVTFIRASTPQITTPQITTSQIPAPQIPLCLITVRHHAPRPFTTYPPHAEKIGAGCRDADQVMLGLLDEIVGRLADILEGSGRALDAISGDIYGEQSGVDAVGLHASLRKLGREGDVIGRVRLALLTIDRLSGYLTQAIVENQKQSPLRMAIKGLARDVHSLLVHADFLSSRLAMASDATLGMINLSQNRTIKIFSVMAVVFMPPTVIASAYGMNFAHMPELQWAWGYPMALGLMLASAVGTYLFFKWRKWL
ncbi:MAG: magnesium transporter CorA family protein, partial [Paracoccaceae bacterium]|nr:magnesium transporter CorA family protein [Paracoccaceae bacterium]